MFMFMFMFIFIYAKVGKMDMEIKKKIDTEWLTYEELLNKYYEQFFEYHKRCFLKNHPFVSEQEIESHTYKVLQSSYNSYDSRLNIAFTRIALKIHWHIYHETVYNAKKKRQSNERDV